MGGKWRLNYIVKMLRLFVLLILLAMKAWLPLNLSLSFSNFPLRQKNGGKGIGGRQKCAGQVCSSICLGFVFLITFDSFLTLFSFYTWRYMSLPQPDQKVQCTYVWIGENIKQINNLSAFADIFICQHFQPIVTITWGGISNLFCNTSKNHDVLIIDSVDVEHNN